MIQEEIKCYHCKKIFYIDGFKLQNAKTVSCLYCGKRVDKRKICVIENCNERRFKECCYGMCAKHCGEKKHHYLENGKMKYPNIFRDKK